MPTDPTPNLSESDLDYGRTLRGLRAGMKVFDGRYELKQQLGRGGMGVVWLAQDGRLDRVVALKFLLEAAQDDAAAVDELKRETRRCLELTHPNIVRIYDFEQERNAAAIAMEYIEGPTLADLRLQRPKRVLDAADILPWLKPALTALSYAHNERMMVHRDLKPSNFMLTANGTLKVMDFGIARSVGETRTGPTLAGARMAGGTLAYMSPQQLLGHPPAVSDDIYSLGATLYELLTGKPPFFRGSIERQIEAITPPGMMQRRGEFEIEGTPPIPAIWEEVVAACLEKDAAKRPRDVAEVWERLSGGKSATPPKPASERAKAEKETAPQVQAAKEALPQQKASEIQPPPLPVVVPVNVKSPFNPAPPYVKKVADEKKTSDTFIPPARETGTSLPLFVPPMGEAVYRLTQRPPPGRESSRQPKHRLSAQTKVLMITTGGIVLTAIIFGLAEMSLSHPMSRAAAPAPFTPHTALEASMAASTQFSPFINSLGMRFVPLSVAAGPTAGQLVMVSLWETRVGDYAAYTKENGLVMMKPNFVQEDDHPVVNVSWQEARAFCDWLTQREQGMERIPAKARYRLPSDHEWSCAADIGDKEDAALPPAAKTLQIVDYPWGSAEMPPANAGNYHPSLGIDSYIGTAPVTNFPPNWLGMHSMGGNVSEWCADWYDEQRHQRVLRGSSWLESSLPMLRLSCRFQADPNTRHPATGFRVVLVVDAVPPAS